LTIIAHDVAWSASRCGSWAGPAIAVDGIGGAAADHLLRHLRDMEMLLLLDTMEHLVDEGGLIADILASAPGVAILATSRVRLAVRGERLFGARVAQDTGRSPPFRPFMPRESERAMRRSCGSGPSASSRRGPSTSVTAWVAPGCYLSCAMARSAGRPSLDSPQGRSL
jgi:hypothetical protein